MARAAKIETASERYRRRKAEKAATEELYDVPTPIYGTWECRRPNLAQFVMNGMMPMTLAGRLAEAGEAKGDPAAAFNSLDWKDKARTIEFSAAVVRYCAVKPRIVENPSGPNEIAFEEVEMDDFNAIFTWAMPGGDGAGTLNTFPAK